MNTMSLYLNSNYCKKITTFAARKDSGGKDEYYEVI